MPRQTLGNGLPGAGLQEKARRYSSFLQTVRGVGARSGGSLGSTMRMGVNGFADWSDQEFRAAYLGQRSVPNPQLRCASLPACTVAAGSRRHPGQLPSLLQVSDGNNNRPCRVVIAALQGKNAAGSAGRAWVQTGCR